MATSRRSFLKTGTLGALATGVSLGLGKNILGHAAVFSPGPPLDLNRVAFEAKLRSAFLVRSGTAKARLTLVEVTSLGSRKTARGEKEAFSLLFRGDNSNPLKQDTYAIQHDELGTFSFLVVPVVSKDKSGRYYEVVVNRLYP